MTVKWKLGTIQLMWPACRYGYFTKSRVEGGYRFPVDPLLSLLGAGREKPWERGLQSRTSVPFWRRHFDVFVLFLFSAVKSNSPKPTEEEEKEKAPQTEESEETEKEEDTKMEHWTFNISPSPSARIPPVDLLLPPIRPSFFDSPLASSIHRRVHAWLNLLFFSLDTEWYSSV